MIITTTHTIEGHKILEYRGLVAGEAILGANLFRDIFASIRDLVGGRSGAYEKVLNPKFPGIKRKRIADFVGGSVS